MKESLGILLIVLIITAKCAFSQSGPAGVGSSVTNVLWLRADKGTSTTTSGNSISYWNDQSGNAINVSQSTAAQRPLFRTNIMNGNPAIEFDNNSTAGQNDFLTAPDNILLDSTAGYTFFTVTRMKNLDNSSARSILSKRTTIDIDEAFMLFYYTNNYFYTDIDGLGDRYNTGSPAFGNNTNYIIDVAYNGTLSAANRSKTYEGETLRKTSSESSAFVANKVSPLLIGSTHVGDARSFGGYMAEIIMYRTVLSDASRIIINNYLSAKYDVALSANDKYAGDSNANGDYDFNVAGIGKESSGSNISFDESTTAGIKIAVNSGLDNGDYILAGHNVVQNSQLVWDVGGMTGINNARFLRIWYLDITNTSTSINVNISFDMSDAGMNPVMGNVSDYVLLYRATQTGNWTEIKTADAISGDKVLFNNMTITNDGYYTLGTHNYINTPLPVELTLFNAALEKDKVAIQWQTASEINNDYFVTEKSNDGEHFIPIHEIKGAGNSTSTLNYHDLDANPFQDVSYYRLKQVDYNGAVEYSPVVTIRNYSIESSLSIYPNPLVSDELHINFELAENTTAALRIGAADGRNVYQSQIAGNSYNKGMETINHHFLPGIYIVELVSDEIKYIQKLVVK